ncbi:hypothetical protein EGT09_02515 [Pseudomonas putida]|nr:hypothetical protein EGT09_02515 [Pseudomonas putida]
MKIKLSLPYFIIVSAVLISVTVICCAVWLRANIEQSLSTPQRLYTDKYSQEEDSTLTFEKWHLTYPPSKVISDSNESFDIPTLGGEQAP